MDNLLSNISQIISTAAQSNLGILALLSIALSVLAYTFFSAASEKVKVRIFAFRWSGWLWCRYVSDRASWRNATSACQQ
jgi:hypothetical protein